MFAQGFFASGFFADGFFWEALSSANDGYGYSREQNNTLRIISASGIRPEPDATERAMQAETSRLFVELNNRPAQTDYARQSANRTTRNRQRNTTRH